MAEITPAQFGNLFDEAVSGACSALFFTLEHWDEFDAWITVKLGRQPTREVYQAALAVLDTFTPTGQEARRG